ncbi:hypothetical protein F4678DRAFT_71698 [Xylaria arbuscula]|nr:hypothetical protein F4678DRAFT_71698 [Xylaria arbuscula]
MSPGPDSLPPRQSWISTNPKSRPGERKIILLGTVRLLGVIVCFAFVACLVLVLVPFIWPTEQRHPSTPQEFGIGFDLSPAYATVAVSYPDGSIRPIARVEGDEEYREMMYRLSLPSSQHVHKPYRGVGDAISDIPRQIRRSARKKLGLPCSKDVATLSRMIQVLRYQASSFVGEPVSAAAISAPHLRALYNEDIEEAFEYLSLVYIKLGPSWYSHYLPTTLAVCAGNGLGICRDYKDQAACWDEEWNMRSRYMLAVGYTRTSITTSLATITGWQNLSERAAYEILDLGHDNRHNRDEESYWIEVRTLLRLPVVHSPIRSNISTVLVSGDAATKLRFREVLGEAVDSVLDGVPAIFDHEPEFSAARGVAELAKRAILRQRKGQDTMSEL